jgi:purine-nucleoside phosphorylase
LKAIQKILTMHLYHKNITPGTFTQSGIGFSDIADVGIIIESYRILEHLIEQEYVFELLSSYHLDFDWLVTKKGKKRFAVCVSQGAAMAVDLAERFVASGAEYIIRIGTTGSLVADLALGAFVVPYAAIRDEGTSRFYLSRGAPSLSDITLTLAISKQLRIQGFTVYNGIAWSTDGRWKETDEMVERYVNDGAIAADMESSALFAFGLNKKVKVASISLLSDEIHSAQGEKFKGLSDKQIWFDKVLPACNQAFMAVLNVLS